MRPKSDSLTQHSKMADKTVCVAELLDEASKLLRENTPPSTSSSSDASRLNSTISHARSMLCHFSCPI